MSKYETVLSDAFLSPFLREFDHGGIFYGVVLESSFVSGSLLDDGYSSRRFGLKKVRGNFTATHSYEAVSSRIQSAYVERVSYCRSEDRTVKIHPSLWRR